jgi:putative phosphoribosyl transferase
VVEQEDDVRFASRLDAGKKLIDPIAQMKLSEPVIVGASASARAVAQGLARGLGVPSGVYGASHLALPWRPALPFGAITDDGHTYLDPEVVADHSLGPVEIAEVSEEALAGLRRRRPRRPSLAGHTAVVVVDALSTGYLALAVAEAARAAHASSVVVAAPCAAQDAAERVIATGLTFVALVTSDGPRFDASFFYVAEESAPARILGA